MSASIGPPYKDPNLSFANKNGDQLLASRNVSIGQQVVGMIATIETKFGGICYRVILNGGYVEDIGSLPLAKKRTLNELMRRVGKA